MRLKLFASAMMAACVAAGGAFAQATPDFASEDERAMYEENADIMGDFFTDETMTEMRSQEEVTSAFEAMGAESQDEMRAACETAMDSRGSYGTVTIGLCEQVMAM